MRKPEFITFTGADERTSIAGMLALSARYPIEWGILLSPDRQGNDPRYPSLGVVDEILTHSTRLGIAGYGLRLAGHLCGGYSRAIMRGERPSSLGLQFGLFERFQINAADVDVDMVALFSERVVRGKCIAQWREIGGFPSDERIDWVFDQSGGRGEAPNLWPPHPIGFRLVGYAGGINPENVRDVVQVLGGQPVCGPYWIDMESGVRTDNWFDLNKVRQVCEAVYG